MFFCPHCKDHGLESMGWVNRLFCSCCLRVYDVKIELEEVYKAKSDEDLRKLMLPEDNRSHLIKKS
jgi:hypothetical protein